MWLLFHRNAKTKVLADGETFVEKCPECGRRATFQEVEVSESFGVFFVDLVGDRERAFRCSACGDVFDLKDRGLPAAKTKTLDELAEEARIDEQRRLVAAEARKEAAEAKAVRIDDELAELKKRMGR
jgi:uncharacterized C2H2 Zn-finger protein